MVNYGSPEYPQYAQPDQYEKYMKEVQGFKNTVNNAKYPNGYYEAGPQNPRNDKENKNYFPAKNMAVAFNDVQDGGTNHVQMAGTNNV